MNANARIFRQQYLDLLRPLASISGYSLLLSTLCLRALVAALNLQGKCTLSRIAEQ